MSPGSEGSVPLMALDSTARQAEDGYLLVPGLAKDRRLLTGSADEVHLSPTDPARSDEIGLSPTGPTSLDETALLVNDPPGPAEEGHGFGFVTTTTTAGSEEDVVTTTAESAGKWHGLVAPISSSNLNQSLLAPMSSMNKSCRTTRFAETQATPRFAETRATPRSAEA